MELAILKEHDFLTFALPGFHNREERIVFY
jgi:hypothetical protein